MFATKPVASLSVFSLSILIGVCATASISGCRQHKEASTPLREPSVASQPSSTMTNEQAVSLVAQKLGSPIAKNSRLDCDSSEERDGRSFYVVHYYDIVVDNPATGEAHTATWGWFYVDRNDKRVFKLDMVENTLIPFSKDGD